MKYLLGMSLMHESKYINETSLKHRKEFGQFFTPPHVSQLMAKWVMKNNPKTILDPAFGLGVFYDQIKKFNLGSKLHFTGYEIDNHIIDYINPDNRDDNLKIINDDYLESDLGSFDGIICNPPYMRFQKFLNRHDVLPKIEEKIGRRLIGYANTASVFLIKSLNELAADGTLSFIMPFEFFNTGYGKDVKKSLLENHLLKQIIIFSNEKEIFPDATTTVCILLCRNNGNKKDIKITRISTTEEIDRISDISEFYQKTIPPSKLPYNKKWTPIIMSLFSEQKLPESFCSLSVYGKVVRGIATGANEFFALTKSKIEKLQLGDNNICKCITKSSQIREKLFTEFDFNVLNNADKPVHCLDVKDHEKPEIINYINEGEKQGYHHRYLTKVRKTWYKIENRKPAPILFGVFNRGRLKVIRNFTSAINFTCFHSFYPNAVGQTFVNKLFVYFISDIGQKIIKTNKRIYGNELDKFEPGDLSDSLCPNQKQLKTISDEDASKVIDLLKVDKEKAIELSNNLIERIIDTHSREGAYPNPTPFQQLLFPSRNH
jgi:adenine-specific DNA-methyltransferase